MKSRKLTIGLLIMFALLVSSVTFAYWATTVSGNNDTATGKVTIGSSSTVSTTVTVGDESDLTTGLVPTAYVTATDTDTATLTFNVLWAESGSNIDPGTVGDITVSVNSVEIDSNDVSSLFTITSPGGTVTLGGASQTVTVTVVFSTEPADLAAYNAIANGTLTIGLTFTVAPQ